MMRGRPKKTEINNFDVAQIGQYFMENKKEENITEDNTAQNQESPNEEVPNVEYIEDTPPPQSEIIEEHLSESKKKEILLEEPEEDIIDLEGFIKVDANGIKMADVVVSSVLESIFNFMGWQKEVQLLSTAEVKFFEKNLPSLKIKKNWKNIIIIYLFSKLK